MTWILPGVEIIPPPPHILRARIRRNRYRFNHPERVAESARKQRESQKRKDYLAAYAERNKDKLREQAKERQRKSRLRRRMLGVPIHRNILGNSAERSDCLPELS